MRLPLYPFGKRGHEHYIAFALVRTFLMIMGDILMEGIPQGSFPKQNQPRQGFVLHGAYLAFRIRVQIGAPRR
jgi:hypothetical protein